MEQVETFLQGTEKFLWSYIGILLIIVCGLYFSFLARFKQIWGLSSAFSYFFKSLLGSIKGGQKNHRGSNTLEVFFASLGSCIGAGNIVSIAVAIQIGGPGALFWVWLVAFLGMIIKYAEVYLGLRFRVENSHGSYDGGPMFFLRYAFPQIPILSSIMAFLMCIYGTEIYMFSVIKESLVENFNFPEPIVVVSLLLLTIFSVAGGVKRVGKINSFLVPFFIIIYMLMVGYILIINISHLPEVFYQITSSAFSGHAAIGGFAGSSTLLTMAKGISSACYSGDIGVGYASIVHSETSIRHPERQASFAIVGIFIDTLIVCTATIFLILVTGVWHEKGLSGSMLVQNALARYFPHMDLFMSAFIFMLGFPTITAYLVAAMKSASFLSPKRGKIILLSFSSASFVLFSFFDSTLALSVMLISGGLLVSINIPAIIRLRKHIKYNF